MKNKKILAILLAVLTVLSVLAVATNAEGEATGNSPGSAAGNLINNQEEFQKAEEKTEQAFENALLNNSVTADANGVITLDLSDDAGEAPEAVPVNAAILSTLTSALVPTSAGAEAAAKVVTFNVSVKTESGDTVAVPVSLNAEAVAELASILNDPENVGMAAAITVDAEGNVYVVINGKTIALKSLKKTVEVPAEGDEGTQAPAEGTQAPAEGEQVSQVPSGEAVVPAAGNG